MDALTILPPIMAILIAVVARNVYAALIVALVMSETMLASLNPALGITGGLDRTVAVFEDSGNARILIFCLLIGALIALIRDSGGVAAMAKSLIQGGFAKTRRRAELAVAGTGTAIFVETNVSLLSAGVLGRPLYDAYKLSRERLAYIIDSTSAPISVLFLVFNAWGQYALGLIGPYGFDKPMGVVAASIGWNFYALITLALVYFTVISGKVVGPLRTADSKVETSTEEGAAPTKAIYMWLPLAVLVLGSLGFMLWTGKGVIWEGSGSRSIMYAIALAIAVVAILLRIDKVFSSAEIQTTAFKGIGEMVPLVAVLLLSIALGDSLKALGTGAYVAEIASGTLPPFTVPAILFAVAGATSFMTGTSWGTYAILIPIAMPVAMALGIPPSLALAAVLGGGVFGDHCSPISDTTLIASVAAGTDHLAHVKTQLPYALFAAILAVGAYLAAGVMVTGS